MKPPPRGWNQVGLCPALCCPRLPIARWCNDAPPRRRPSTGRTHGAYGGTPLALGNAAPGAARPFPVPPWRRRQPG
eukprot:3928401-Alexandrium_andersonii.AAC.1